MAYPVRCIAKWTKENLKKPQAYLASTARHMRCSGLDVDLVPISSISLSKDNFDHKRVLQMVMDDIVCQPCISSNNMKSTALLITFDIVKDEYTHVWQT